MNYQNLSKVLKISENRAKKILTETGTSPSLRSLNVDQIKQIIIRAEKLTRITFSALTQEEWELVLGSDWNSFSQYMRPKYKLDVELFSATKPIQDIRAQLSAPHLSTKRGPLPDDWDASPLTYLHDSSHRPKMLVRENEQLITILGVEETVNLLGKHPFRATLEQWERLLPGSLKFLKQHRDGKWFLSDKAAIIRRRINNERS